MYCILNVLVWLPCGGGPGSDGELLILCDSGLLRVTLRELPPVHTSPLNTHSTHLTWHRGQGQGQESPLWKTSSYLPALQLSSQPSSRSACPGCPWFGLQRPSPQLVPSVSVPAKCGLSPGLPVPGENFLPVPGHGLTPTELHVPLFTRSRLELALQAGEGGAEENMRPPRSVPASRELAGEGRTAPCTRADLGQHIDGTLRQPLACQEGP